MLVRNIPGYNIQHKDSFLDSNRKNLQNFKSANKQEAVCEVKYSPKQFGLVDCGIITIGASLGASIGYINSKHKLSNFEKELKSYIDFHKKEKPEVTALKDDICARLFSDLIYREAEGKPSDIPNCVMITGRNEKYHNEVIKWIADQSICRFVTVDPESDNLLAKLEHQKATYKTPGKDYTLMYVKNLEKWINPKLTDFSDIEAMKDIMSSTSEDYHTTLIFGSEHPEKLDSIALQPHRVRTGILNVNRDDFFFREDTLKRIKEISNKAQNTSLKKNTIVMGLIGFLVGAGAVLIKNKNNLFKNKEKEV